MSSAVFRSAKPTENSDANRSRESVPNLAGKNYKRRFGRGHLSKVANTRDDRRAFHGRHDACRGHNLG
jgi:hypothetical protein